MGCPRCGDAVSPQAAICGRCGLPTAYWRAQGGAPQAIQPSGGSNAGARRYAVIAAVVAGILVAGATTYTVASSSSRNRDIQNAGSLQARNAPNPGPELSTQGSMPEPALTSASRVPSSDSLTMTGTSTDPGLEATGQMPSPALQIPAVAETPSLVVPSTPAAPSLTRSSDEVTMPADVRSWLEHLERCERERLSISTAQLTSAFTQMAQLQADDASNALDPDKDDNEEQATQRVNRRADNVAQSMETLRRSWSQLNAKFNSVQPPAECVSLKASYNEALSNTGTMILEIVGTVRSAAANRQGALASLMAMQGKSSDRIDRPARQTDSGVEAICRKYQTVKWFDIKSDVGGGVMSKLGM